MVSSSTLLPLQKIPWWKNSPKFKETFCHPSPPLKSHRPTTAGEPTC